jgi:ArsR family transcriptional regulator
MAVALIGLAKYGSVMDRSHLLPTLSALAQATRLKVVVLLADAGSRGMASGDIADALAIPRHLMSAHLAVLSKADVITSEKKGRSVLYWINSSGIMQLSRSLNDLIPQGDIDLSPEHRSE